MFALCTPRYWDIFLDHFQIYPRYIPASSRPSREQCEEHYEAAEIASLWGTGHRVVCYLWNSRLEEEGHPASSSYFRLGMARVPGFWLMAESEPCIIWCHQNGCECCHPNHPGNALTNDCWEWFNGDRWLVWWYLVICKWDTWLGSSQQIRNMTLSPKSHGFTLPNFPIQIGNFQTEPHHIVGRIYTHIRPTGFSRCLIRRNPSIQSYYSSCFCFFMEVNPSFFWFKMGVSINGHPKMVGL